MFISRERHLDVLMRGKTCMVYDLDGKQVKLCESRVWVNDKGDYFYPIEVEDPICASCTIS
jgi:hypothetical protein